MRTIEEVCNKYRIHPSAFLGCYSSKFATLVPCGKIKLLATTTITEERWDKIAYFPLLRKMRISKEYEGCGNVVSPRVLSFNFLDKTKDILRANAVNPLLAKGVENPEYQEVKSDFPIFAFSFGKPRKSVKIEKGMKVGIVNYFGGIGFILANNKLLQLGKDESLKEIEKKIVNNASRVYNELYNEELFVEDITEMGVKGIKEIETRYSIKIKIDKVKIYSLPQYVLDMMQGNPIGEFNAIVIGKESKVEDFLEMFKRIGIEAYIAGEVK
ncbi:hypothetical protein [Acidianus sp. HS-5]|uniref:hypothetical protein n=1 Tax=Acidianus sp. HS-5 TaxID=2886040 RepID=UPI001F385623|nr:hypothetical protein [Acidianus sp. HS-5]BDC17278.1 hypothetical protein HS5_01680 [Acidianus sp. HS-5]